MPCEGCQVQFTVFRRKRSCAGCKRFYCSNCLQSGSPKKRPATLSQVLTTALCERCKLFAKRPLLRNDLLQMKPKDLIFYLQSKHISTAGCVEKDELVGLVLNYVQETEHGQAANEDGDREERRPEAPHSFQSLKQSCQTFFNNITENLSDSFAAFEAAAHKSEMSPTSPTATEHTATTAHISDQPRVAMRELPTYASSQQQQLHPEQRQYSPLADETDPRPTEERHSENFPRLDDMCWCEDHEQPQVSQVQVETVEIVPQLGQHLAENSSQSSFEELGAIGGLSDESKTVTTDSHSQNGSSNSSGTMEQWHILETPSNPPNEEHTTNGNLEEKAVKPLQQTKRVTRRRSESFLQRQRQRRHLSSDDSPTTSICLPRIESCGRCGKYKTSLRQNVEKMRQYLESAQMSEADIKRELRDFLLYLDNRTKSLDSEQGEAEAEPSSELDNASGTLSPLVTGGLSYFDDNAGIHVYPVSSPDNSAACKKAQRRFISLNDFNSLQDLECLSVKKLKEVLMLNRVDYKGCCEKQELLDRVVRLWKNLKSTPATEQLPTDELCKICMDAPIECVILECGHMATCTDCGKVLSECPICRQYIVRVVRFFRA